MSDLDETTEDAVSGEEISGTAVHSTSPGQPTVSKRNAFTELMSSPKKVKVRSKDYKQALGSNKSGSAAITTFPRRDGLAAYLNHPSSFPNLVLYSNSSFVAIKDLYPKSSIHILLIPHTPHSTLHPFLAFEDQALLDSCKAEVTKVKKLAASELRRLHGKWSSKESARLAAMEKDEVCEKDRLPEGRDWEDEIMAGVHAGPSMNHLHVHIISKDRHSECLKHRKHYNSFATPFFVRLEEFPLKSDDPRRKPDRGGWLRVDMKCWRCGTNFGNRFVELKRHLEVEFEEWREE